MMILHWKHGLRGEKERGEERERYRERRQRGVGEGGEERKGEDKVSARDRMVSLMKAFMNCNFL